MYWTQLKLPRLLYGFRRGLPRCLCCEPHAADYDARLRLYHHATKQPRTNTG